MDKKTLFLLITIILIIISGLFFFLSGQRNTKNISPEIKITPKVAAPSETFIEYTDPSGFSFSYPDNLSLSNTATDDSADVIDPDTYAQLQLFSNDVSGSLNLKIADTKIKSLDQWLKANNIPDSNTPAEKQLGNLKAIEVKTNDRLMLASLDQGVLFTIDFPLIEQDFWLKVYDKVIKDFTFAAPETNTAQAGSPSSEDGIIFEGEEVIE